MTTARDVIYRTLRMLGVSDPEETPTGPQAEFALVAMNAMVHGWTAQGVDVGHEDWSLDTEVTLELAPRHINALTALLGIELLPEYPGAVLSPTVGAAAQMGWSGLQAAYKDTSSDSDLMVDRAFQNRRL